MSKENLRCINPQLLDDIEKRGFNYLRISFRDETDPIFLVYEIKPTLKEISTFIKKELGMSDKDGYTITWND